MLTAGGATCEITPDLGSAIQGATVNQTAKSVRDPLQANALYICQEGDGRSQKLLLISCDVAGFGPWLNNPLREKIATAVGLDETSILIGATHTHAGPNLMPTNYHKKVDQTYIQRLDGWLIKVARDAIASAKPAELAWGQGQQQLGYNRRCCWADGSHTMHGDTTRPDFTGLEGPDDPTHTVIAVRELDNPEKFIGLVHANTAHPTIFYGRDFFSADFPGFARTHLRQVLGDIPILFFNGALGDISNEDMLAPDKRSETPDRKLARLGHLLAGQTLHLLYHAPWKKDIELTHEFQTLTIPVRLPAAAALDEARALLTRVDQGEKVAPMSIALAHGTVLLDKEYADSPEDHLRLHAIKLDGLALVNAPVELYCQFGLDIRRRSPAKATAILGLTDGAHGYCPTIGAIRGGGYSGQPIFWTRLVEDAGERIVDALSMMLRKTNA